MTSPWGDSLRWNSAAARWRSAWGGPVRKVAVDAGFTCPNRDGTSGRGGCTFCDNAAFSPAYCSPAKSVAQQVADGIAFQRRRHRDVGRWLVYFQSHSNTYAPPERLRELWHEALAHPAVAGIVVATRPDCLDAQRLDCLAEVARTHYVAVELGIESTSDRTLRAVNRGHDFACARRAAAAVAALGIPVGGHFILGFPGEDDDFLIAQTERISSLPLTTVKFHQLQLFRGTALAAEYDADPARFRFRSPEEYADLCVEILRRLRPGIAVERFASEVPARFRCGPGWDGLRAAQLRAMIEKRLIARNAHQGEFFIPLGGKNGTSQPPADAACGATDRQTTLPRSPQPKP